IDEAVWREAVDVLSRADTVALACHVDPDGDALGSMLALQRCLESLGIKTTASWGTAGDDVGNELAIPPQYSFLPGLDALVTPEHFPARPAVMVAFDTGAAERLGSLRSAADAADTLIVIDHHAVGHPFGDIRLVDGSLAATAVLVDELIRRLGGTLDHDMAVSLYTALVTDTGRFQYATTTPAVLKLAARLVGVGIDHAAICRQVWNTHSFGYLKLLAQVLERAELEPRSRLLWTVLTQDDLRRYGVAWQETEGLIEVLRSVGTAEVAMIAKEQSDGVWKVSLRSRGDVDVGRVARQYDGGGHAFLAGLVSNGDVGDLVARISATIVSQGPIAGNRRVD
ncbi:MAG TPA: bifunctional oligoribonuclease/PAP phosphatase NrnA, partial [Euzebyales bacterium]|nr:bifunctional oligoribonuclease/PAP phosphatase NrnA [Euzebyales bacterium]